MLFTYIALDKRGGLAHLRIIVYLLGTSSFLYVIFRFTLSKSHTKLFPARFTLPGLVQEDVGFTLFDIIGFILSSQVKLSQFNLSSMLKVVISFLECRVYS